MQLFCDFQSVGKKLWEMLPIYSNSIAPFEVKSELTLSGATWNQVLHKDLQQPSLARMRTHQH